MLYILLLNILFKSTTEVPPETVSLSYFYYFLRKKISILDKLSSDFPHTEIMIYCGDSRFWGNTLIISLFIFRELMRFRPWVILRNSRITNYIVFIYLVLYTFKLGVVFTSHKSLHLASSLKALVFLISTHLDDANL